MELRSGDQDRIVEMLGQAVQPALAGDFPNGLQQLHDPRF
jgi:hypothetical protein